MTQPRIASGLAAFILLEVSVCAAPPRPEAWDSSQLEAFVDGMMEAQQKAHHFAGAVVAIVRDGQVALEKGYGFADFAARKPVDAQRTLFRVASNSKMFVWTAVMQLVEQGKLDLQTDVNHYLKGLQVPPAFGQPITLEHLMTHTAGFEDKFIGLFSKTPDKMRPLAKLLKDEMPARVYPPGKVTAYSNYGTSLAALIVEQVSGVPYEKYLQTRILDPLGMAHATLAQPLPESLAADISKGYRWTGGRLIEQSFEYVPWAPCGGMSVSGDSMTRFMMAHLNDGALAEARILRPETARAMRERFAAFSPAMNGMLHGFMDMNWNGEKIYGHGGDTVWFHSLTAMLPERRIGVFVAYNTDSGASARGEFSPAFFDHFFPLQLVREPAARKETRTSLERFAGTYCVTRASETDLTRIQKLLTAVSMSTDPDGYLVTNSRGWAARWRQTDPLVFAEVDGKRQLVFRETERGEVMDACASPICLAILQKQPWWESRTAQFAFLAACLAVLAIALVSLPIAAIIQRKQQKPAGSQLARLNAWLASLALVTGFAIMSVKLQDPGEIVFGSLPGLSAALTLWVAGAVLSIALMVFILAAWRSTWWNRTGRISMTLVGLAAAGAVLWLHHWNLLGWRFGH